MKDMKERLRESSEIREKLHTFGIFQCENNRKLFKVNSNMFIRDGCESTFKLRIDHKTFIEVKLSNKNKSGFTLQKL